MEIEIRNGTDLYIVADRTEILAASYGDKATCLQQALAVAAAFRPPFPLYRVEKVPRKLLGYRVVFTDTGESVPRCPGVYSHAEAELLLTGLHSVTRSRFTQFDDDSRFSLLSVCDPGTTVRTRVS